jgi:hypothetical protein
VEAECRFIRGKTAGFEMEDEGEKEVLLQVVEHNILQRGENGQLLAYLPCDYEIQF